MAAKRPIERSQIVWSFFCAVLLGGVIWWALQDSSKTASGYLKSDVQLYLGFVILAMIFLVMCFTLRKWGLFFYYAFLLKPRPGMDEYIDKAQFAIKALQRKIDQGVVTNIRDVRERAQKALVDAGVERSMRLRYKSKVVGGKKVPEVEMYRKEPFGRLFRWLEIHIFFGLLSFAIAVVHADPVAMLQLQFGGPVAAATLGLFALTIFTGLIGLYFYFVVPSRLAEHETEITWGETRKQLEKIEDELEVLMSASSETVKKAFAPYVGGLVKGGAVNLGALTAAHATLDGKEKEAFERGLVMLGQAEKLEHYYRPQNKQRQKLQSWLYFHIPFSIGMIVFMIIHMLSVWYY